MSRIRLARRHRKTKAASKDVLDVFEAAWLIGAHVETLRRLARRDDVPAYKVGKDWRFRKGDLEHWIETHHLRSQRSKVLIVDDDRRILSILRRMLERHNYGVSEAETGEEALGLLKKATPDVVLLDLKLPGIDGSVVLKEIRENYGSLPVIVISAYPDSELMDQALKHAPFMMLPKPVGSNELLEAVRLALGAPQSADRRTGQKEKGRTDFGVFFENAPDYCYMISPNGIILAANPAALRALGYRNEELVGKPLQTIYAPECVPRMQELFSVWRQKGKIENERMTIISKTGERRKVLLSASIVKNGQGEICHSVSIQRDIGAGQIRKEKS